MGRSRGRQIITGLDVGTTKICCVIAEWSSIGTLDIVGVGTSPSRGLRKGVVVNIDSTVESIKQAVGDAEEMAGVEIASVLAGVAGGHIRGVNSRGVIAVSGKHREVSQADVDRALDAARSGLVITAIQGRDYARIYMKELERGKAATALSPEEQEAVDRAMGR